VKSSQLLALMFFLRSFVRFLRFVRVLRFDTFGRRSYFVKFFTGSSPWSNTWVLEVFFDQTTWNAEIFAS